MQKTPPSQAGSFCNNSYIPHIIDLHGQTVSEYDLTVTIVNAADISRYGHMHAGGFTIIGDEAGFVKPIIFSVRVGSATTRFVVSGSRPRPTHSTEA